MTLSFKVNCQPSRLTCILLLLEIALTLKKLKSTPMILSVLYIQTMLIWKVIIVYIYDLDFDGQPSRSSNLFQFF